MSIEDIIRRLREDRQIAERERLQIRIAAAFELTRKDAPAANLLKTKIEHNAVPDSDGAQTGSIPVLAVMPESRPLRPLADIAAPLLLEIHVPLPHRRKDGACWDIGAAPVVDNVNELFEAALVALGYQTQKPCEPRRMERLGVKKP